MPSKAVFEEIRQVLDGNGNIEQSLKDKLIMTALVCVYTELEKFKEEFEKRNSRSRELGDKLLMASLGALITLVIGYTFFKVTGVMP